MPDATDLLAEYGRLDPFEQNLLQLLAIIYEPAHTSLIVGCLRALEVKGPRRNQPSPALVNHCLGRLQNSNLVNDQRQVDPEIVEVLTREAAAAGRLGQYAAVVQKEAPASYFYGKWSTRCWRAIRELRIGIYLERFDQVEQALSFLDQQCAEHLTPVPPVVQVVTRPFDRDWLAAQPPSLQFFLLDHVVRLAHRNLEPENETFAYLEDETALDGLSGDERLPFRRLLLHHHLLRADLDRAADVLARHPDVGLATGVAGTIAFLRGDYDGARQLFERDLDTLREMNGSDDVAFFGLPGLFHVLADISGADAPHLARAANQISVALSLFEECEERQVYLTLDAVLKGHSRQGAGDREFELENPAAMPALDLLFGGLAQYWLTGALTAEVDKEILDRHRRARATGYRLLTLCFAALLAETSIDRGRFASERDQLSELTGAVSFIGVVAAEEPWKRSLQALVNLSTTDVEPYRDQQTRLIWLIDFSDGELTVRPKEQRCTADGQWSRGKPISLARLHSKTKRSYLSLPDRKICLAIQKQESADGKARFRFDREKLLPALVGHPFLFLSESITTPVEFISGEPELLVEETGTHLHISFSVPIRDDNILLVQETPTRFKVVRVNESHRRIARITGAHGLTVPAEASEQVLTAIGNISSFMTVHSAIAVDRATRQARDITFVEADSTVYMHLLPYGSGFRLDMFVKPFAAGTHYVKPGQGVENIMAEVDGRRLQTRRNLAEEERRAREIEELCPMLDLAADLDNGDDREWHFHDPEDCLQALTELQQLGDKVVIEWPEGERLRVTHQVSLSSLNLKIRTNRQNWFGISGEVVVDQDLVFDLRDLLGRIERSPGRFIQISDGQFIALSREFRKRIEELHAYAGDIDGDGEVLVHPLAAPSLRKLSEQARTDADRRWYDQIAIIEDAAAETVPVPSTLRAELRDYQLEGYYWLARLARWGIGGCLADDMGLGKTLQSLAIILRQAADGPSLVVAPTSVSTNWVTEVERFTPTLNVKQLGQKQRAETIAALTKFDILITTYTLLQQEIESLANIDWQTIVLDEAQAIKNAATKRSQAAMALNGSFRLITTGTPIENHLGELWNLFQFINPGLLGSHRQFNERFAIPIERYHDRQARLRLKKLIQPFILRRIKSQVLDELPPRTEVTLEVTMDHDEFHFYEALRQNALDQLDRSGDNRSRHLQVLTEIMRLRQACCNPKLIARDTDISSSKLTVFASLIDELIGGRHKVLVFSQFIGHLDIIRTYLDERGITYQYLDGGTSSRDRKLRVEAFQGGDGDLFLISLKAGGLGLNLTAADYVIHMDPWWNPAVEDQASDRAHRIGQTRPVTIYRLVCKNTIEEKIVQLHQEKRDLADSLLEGTDMSGKLSTEELIGLIRNR